MTPLGLDLPDTMRAELRKHFASAPPSPTWTVDELADLTFHAVSEALTAIDRTAARAREPLVQLMVLSVAISTAASVLEETNKSMIASMMRELFNEKRAGAAR